MPHQKIIGLHTIVLNKQHILDEYFATYSLDYTTLAML